MKRAIVLMNLGSPRSTRVADVRRYLDEFLMDARVIDKPWLLRALLVKGIIAPLRAPRSAKAYESIWTPEGSPLINISRTQQQALAAELREPVYLAMRYGDPSPRQVFDELAAAHPDIEEVIAIPMYPHYAMSSYETAVAYAREQHAKGGYGFRLSFVRAFYNNEAYINALTESVRPHLQKPFDRVLFSYHGIPERHVIKCDVTGAHCLKSVNCCQTPSAAHEFCYRHQCYETTRLVANKLGLAPEQVGQSFQSRLGRDPWLVPYTAVRLTELPKEGVKRLVVVCPAFVADCLETLEEMGVEGRHSFLAAGGESFELVPCLNDHPLWISTLANWMRDHAAGDTSLVGDGEVTRPVQKVY